MLKRFEKPVLFNFIEFALRYGCSPVDLLHILRSPFSKNSSGQLLLIFDSRKMILENYGTMYLDLICTEWLLMSFLDHGDQSHRKVIFKTMARCSSKRLKTDWQSIHYLRNIELNLPFCLLWSIELIVKRIKLLNLLQYGTGNNLKILGNKRCIRPQLVKSLVIAIRAHLLKVYNNYESTLIIYRVNRNFSFLRNIHFP